MSSSDRIRSYMSKLMQKNKERLTATDGRAEGEGAAGHHTDGAVDIPPQYNTRGRNHQTLKRSVVIDNSSSGKSSGLIAASSTSSGAAEKQRIHPIDQIEDTFDPIPPNTLPSFVCDFSLFRVAKSLRLLGYDVRCEPNLQGDGIINCARSEKRIVITGSTRMLPKLAKMRRDDIEYRNGKPPPAKVVVGYDSDGGSVYETDSDVDADEDYTMGYIKVHSSDTHDESMLRVLQTLALPWDESRVFTRCVDCNVLIESVPNKSDVEGLVPPGVYELYANFYHCTCCKKVYWGVDKGVAVNYKSVRTIEYLRQYRGAFANGGKSQGDVGAAGDTASTTRDDGIGKDGLSTSTATTTCPAAANLAFVAANRARIVTGGNGTDQAHDESSGVNDETDDGGDARRKQQRHRQQLIVSHNGAPIEVMRRSVRNTRFEDFSLRRHFSSLPRSIKQIVFTFMVPDDILAVSKAIPTVRQLAEAAARGEVFIPKMNSRQLKREYRKRQLIAAEQSGQAPFVRGELREMMTKN